MGACSQERDVRRFYRICQFRWLVKHRRCVCHRRNHVNGIVLWCRRCRPHGRGDKGCLLDHSAHHALDHLPEWLYGFGGNHNICRFWILHFTEILIDLPQAYCVTDIVDMVLENPSPFISIQVYYLGLGSASGATALVCIGISMTYLSAISVQAAASRQAWSFARDGGLPFSSWFHKVMKFEI